MAVVVLLSFVCRVGKGQKRVSGKRNVWNAVFLPFGVE